MTIEIRKLSLEDCFNGSFFETLSRLRPVGDIDKQQIYKIFHRQAINADHHTFVAVKDGKVIGTITVIIEQKWIHNGGIVAHIEDVAVHQDFGGQGVGKALLDQAKLVAWENRCYKIILDCDDDMVEYYGKFGYRRCGNAMRMDDLQLSTS